jgi:predicted regulator of Ras-like GTPase activity (Roadblock/LC7/MglB family)
MPDQKSRSQRMVDRLREMRASSPDIEASAVVSTDGLIVASDLPAAAEEERLSAMSAAILSLGERISNELGRGRLNQVYIRGADGIVFVMPAGDEVVLTVLARREAKLGLVMLDSRRTAEDIAKIV